MILCDNNCHLLNFVYTKSLLYNYIQFTNKLFDILKVEIQPLNSIAMENMADNLTKSQLV